MRASFRSLGLLLLLPACGAAESASPAAPTGDAFVPSIDVRDPDAGGDTDLVDDATAPDATTADGGLVPRRSCETAFTFAPGASVPSVAIAGEWDDFTSRTPMTNEGGTYRASVALPKGDWAYKVVVAGNDWRLDPGHGRRKYLGGVENSRVLVEDCDLPRLEIVRHAATSTGVTIELQYLDGQKGAGLDPNALAVSIKGDPAKVPATIGVDGKVTIARNDLPKGKYTFVIEAKDRAGRAAAPLLIPTWIEDRPYDFRDGPLYFVFTDRFRNGDKSNDAPLPGVDARANYQGGDFAGVLAALKEGWFDDLGVKSIWLAPVNDNTNKPGRGGDGRQYSGYHGYWPIEPRATDEHLGTLAELRAITAEAHKRGIRVLIDLVQNQVHEDHSYVTAHRSAGWFNGDGSCVCGSQGCSWDDRPVDCWFTSYLPDVNWTSTAAADAFIDDAIWWLVEADADGLRVDAVKHMNDVASTALRTEIRARLEGGNARYWLVGETFTGGDDGGRNLIRRYIGPWSLGGQFDFPLYWSIDRAFAQNAGTMAALDADARKSLVFYGPDALMSPFLGNHDVSRFLSRAAGQIANDAQDQAWRAPPPSPDRDEPYERAFLAHAFLLGQPGVPLLYYGDEVGLPGTADPDNRRFMPAESALSARERKLLDRVRILAKARGTHPGLQRGVYTTLLAESEGTGDGYVFARGSGDDLAVVALNRGSTARTIRVAVPASLATPDGTVLRDLLGGPSVTVQGQAIEVPFTPRGASLFVR
jgi:glycosidase